MRERTVFIVRGTISAMFQRQPRYVDLSYWSTAAKAEKALQRYRKKEIADDLEVVAVGMDRDGFTRS